MKGANSFIKKIKEFIATYFTGRETTDDIMSVLTTTVDRLDSRKDILEKEAEDLDREKAKLIALQKEKIDEISKNVRYSSKIHSFMEDD